MLQRKKKKNARFDSWYEDLDGSFLKSLKKCEKLIICLKTWRECRMQTLEYFLSSYYFLFPAH